MDAYISAASGKFTNPFIFNLYCVVSGAQGTLPFCALFDHVLPPIELVDLFGEVERLFGSSTEDENDAIKALLRTVAAHGWRDDAIGVPMLLTEYNRVMAQAQDTRSHLSVAACAEMEARLAARVQRSAPISLTDEQADFQERHTLPEGASLEHLHTIRVINSSEV